jgi:hypothetical protein
MARAQKPSGRATPRTHRGSATGRHLSAEQTGRYTKPIPKDVRRSPRWFGPLVIGLLLLGAFLLVGNYLSFLPGAVSPWYLVAGFISIVAGFGLSTKLR